jgi:hypothetical protein
VDVCPRKGLVPKLWEGNKDFVFAIKKILPGIQAPFNCFNLSLVTDIMNDFQVYGLDRIIFWDKVAIVIAKIKEVIKDK